MRSLIYIVLMLCAFLQVWGQKKDTISVTGNIQFTNNGVSPVPAFALNEPAVIGVYTIKKGKFYHQAILSFEWNAKPWNTLYRFGYDVLENEKWKFSAASYLSIYYARRDIPYQKEEIQIQRYHDFELYVTRKFGPKSALTTTIWYEHAIDQVGIPNAQLIMSTYSLSEMNLGSKLQASFSTSAFYVQNAWGFKGMFVSENLKVHPNDWKFNLFLQATEPIPLPGLQGKFLWNTGVNFPF